MTTGEKTKEAAFFRSGPLHVFVSCTVGDIAKSEKAVIDCKRTKCRRRQKRRIGYMGIRRVWR